MKNGRSILALVLLVFVVAGPACKQNTGPPKTEKITLAAYAGSYGFLPFIAQEKGYFASNGLDVAINEYDFGLKAADALVARKADIATAADFVLTSYSFDHADLRVIGSIARSLTDEIIARKDRGIRTPADLKGRKIGVSPKTKAEFFLARFLILHGMDYQDIKVVHLEPGRIVEAISRGAIDAASIWEPFASEIRTRLGENAVGWPAQSELAFYYLLLSREGWIKEHPEAVRRFLKAMVQAEEFTRENPLEAQQIISKRLGYELPFVQAIWKKNEFTVELPQQILLLMEEGARWRIRNRLTDKKEAPLYLDFIYSEGLKAVKPGAVTIVK